MSETEKQRRLNLRLALCVLAASVGVLIGELLKLLLRDS